MRDALMPMGHGPRPDKIITQRLQLQRIPFLPSFLPSSFLSFQLLSFSFLPLLFIMFVSPRLQINTG